MQIPPKTAPIRQTASTPLRSSSQSGKSIRFTSAFAPFPDSARANGHLYQGKAYPVKDHYSDSSVFIYIPSKFKPGKQLELVVWFHGWHNNIDSALRFFKLVEQFEASGRNALFIFPEGPKNAPDSYGGKLESKGYFDAFIKDILLQLVNAKVLNKKNKPLLENCSISLAGHSGAYRVISKIIQYAKIEELILFDAWYGGNEAYLNWMAANQGNRFLAIYTKDGGTLENTRMNMKQIQDSLKLSIIDLNEAALTTKILQTNKRVFIYSNQSHNGVIRFQNNWEIFLKYRN